MSLKRGILSGFAGGLVMSFASIAISFLQLRILLRLSAANRRRHLAYLFRFWSIRSSLDLGPTQTLGREVSFAVGRQDLDASEHAHYLSNLVRSRTRVIFTMVAVVYPLGALASWATFRP